MTLRADGQEGSTITLPRPKEKSYTDGEWIGMMDTLIEAIEVTESNEYAVTKGNDKLVITTNVLKADIDKRIANMAMIGNKKEVMAGQGSTTALKDKDQTNLGGIDLSQQDAALHVVKDANGGGVVVNVNPALIARIEREGMPEVVPVIINMRPADIRSLFGVGAQLHRYSLYLMMNDSN